MRTIVRRAGVAVAIAAALTLAACTPPSDGPTRSRSPSATPLFSSDEEALAAAEEAYAAYLRVSDQILMDGGNNPERLLEVATEDVLDSERVGYDKARTSGTRSTGGSTFDHMTLQSMDAFDAASAVAVYVCDDVTAVDFLDASGNSIVSPDRPDRFPTTVEFSARTSNPPSLLVASIGEWTGDDFCN
jgi:hypothetical protein